MDPAARPRSILRDLALLSLLCLAVYALGPTASGLINTQETLRLTTAIEMQQRADWIVPTKRGEPYLAKPPMIYWAQLTLARLRGADVALLDLRLSVALAGWAGVLATYLFARRVLPEGGTRRGEVAWWAALGLAVGILYVRSSRLGELDIFLVPFVVTALLGVHGAWRTHLDRRRTGWGWIALAAAATAMAALTKGPVPLFVIGLAGYGGIAVHGALSGAPRTHRQARVGMVGAMVGAGVFALGSALQMEVFGDVLGIMVFSGVGGALGWLVAMAGVGGRARRWAPALWRAHPEIVVGAGVVALAGWGALVRRRVGSEAVDQFVSAEVDNNLLLLQPPSPVRNLEFLAYGLLPMSLATIVALIWLVRERERPDPGRAMVLSWLGLGFVAFSVLGKGVARYLTPLWPAVALVGAIWLADALRREARDAGESSAAQTRTLLYALVLVFAGAQVWWYADAQNRFFGDVSARDFGHALRDAEWFDPDRTGTYALPSLMLDHYVGARLDEWSDRASDSGFAPMLAEILDRPEPYHVIAPADWDAPGVTRGGRLRLRDVLDALALAGRVVERVEVGASWRPDADEGPVVVLRIIPGASPSPDAPSD